MIDSLFVENYLEKIGLSVHTGNAFHIGILIGVILLLALLSDIVAKRLILNVLKRIVSKTKVSWDDILIKRSVFDRLSHLAPAIVIYFTIGFVLADYPVWYGIVRSGLTIYMIVITLLVLDSFLNALHDIYKTFPISEGRSIRGYIQITKIILYFVSVILILSIILDKNVAFFFAGLGTIAAVLMLVFKDTILGFVASIQLSANDMARIGDWISMPSHGADGSVIDITLNTVKVRNWDKTISTIPTYALVSESFQNWRGMEDSGGRRIMRSINIDMKSVKFATPDMIEKFRKIIYLKDFIDFRLQEIKKHNEENKIGEECIVNGRRITNLGTFRKYLEEYLKHHPKVHNSMTLMVRHLAPTEKGIPIEIYGFSNDQQWVNYEAIQADIFDHIIAVIPEFELKVFQNPTGDDFKSLANRGA